MQSVVKTFLRYIFGTIVVVSIYLIIIVASIYPHLPKDLFGWIILIFGGIPLGIGFELIGLLILKNEVGEKISKKYFSFTRIVIMLSVFLLSILLSIIFWDCIKTFILPHFT